MNRILTDKIRADILNMGMDLVGFAPVERWKDAPYLLSPPAILPECRTVVVAGIHITDTWTEMGGTPEPQDRSPGGWMNQNDFMDRVAFRTVRTLNKAGYKAIAVVASNIWRYRQFEGIPSLFAPDLSHIHAATAAGLAEIGWSGLAITPEFGSRVRYISIVTEAELVPTPMYDGPKLCDMCGECVKFCPSQAMRKDFNDTKPHVVTIGGKVFRYANKNMWRCAWAEHFNLDLNSKTLDDKHIDENTILNEMNTAGVRGHERGVCQKVCVPPHLRSKEKSFGRNWLISQNRINKRYPDSMPTLRKMRDDIVARAISYGVEIASVNALDLNTPAGKLVEKDAPGMRTVFGFAFRMPKYLAKHDHELPAGNANFRYAYNQKMHFALLRIARMIEDYGYKAASYTMDNMDYVGCELQLAEQAGLGKLKGKLIETPEFGVNVMLGCVVTDALVDASDSVKGTLENLNESKLTGKALRTELEDIARHNLMTMFGVAPAKRIDKIADQLKTIVNEAELGEAVIDDNKKLSYHGPFVPKIINDGSKIRKPKDYLKSARSVIVIGTHFNDEVVQNLALEKSQQIGCYGFMEFQVPNEMRFAAMEICDKLQKMGYDFFVTDNLLGVGSRLGSARGLQPDMRCNALEAVAAGLGELGEQGALLTKEHGPHQRALVIVTDAELPTDEVQNSFDVCLHCQQCQTHCTMDVVKSKFATIDIDGHKVEYPLIERHRCDWAKRYSLNPAEGPGLIGSITDVKAPKGKITINDIAEACKEKDAIMKSRTCVYEPCLRHCPAGDNAAKRLPPKGEASVKYEVVKKSSKATANKELAAK